MRDLLKRAIAEIEKLPAEEQDAVATRILADLADEEGWSSCFNATTNEEWDRIAELVWREIEVEDTISLDDIFPRFGHNPIGVQ